MRFLSICVLRNCKFKYQLNRRLSTHQTLKQEVELKPLEGPLVVAEEWPVEHSALREAALRDVTVLPDFVSREEETALLHELEPALRRMRYEFDHWDDAIHGYRETERASWSEENEAVFCRVRHAAFSPAAGDRGRPLPRQHVLDLAPAGYIKPHVDAVRFCGDVIAGLCLLSSAVMRFTHVTHNNLVFEALLPQRCLYIMRGVARYDFKHEVPTGANSLWQGKLVQRGRRVAILTRAAPARAADEREPCPMEGEPGASPGAPPEVPPPLERETQPTDPRPGKKEKEPAKPPTKY